MLESLQNRLLVGTLIALWAGGAIVVVQNRAWTALILSPFILALFYGFILRTWWMLVLMPIAYAAGAYAGEMLFNPAQPLAASEVLQATVSFAAGLALIQTIQTIRASRSTPS